MSFNSSDAHLIGHRWLRDGRYVADRVKLLRGKVTETLEVEVEVEPGAKAIAEAIQAGRIDHRLCDVVSLACRDVDRAERRLAAYGLYTAIPHAQGLVLKCLQEKLEGAGVCSVRDIPSELTLTARQVAPDLLAQSQPLEAVDIPGLYGGRRVVSIHWASQLNRTVPVVELLAPDVKYLEGWPKGVFLLLPQFDAVARQLSLTQELIVWKMDEAERLDSLRKYFAQMWRERMRRENWPMDQSVQDPREAELRVTPNPVVWCRDFITGEMLVSYAGLSHEVVCVNGCTTNDRWFMRWFGDSMEAEQADAEARLEAASLTAKR